MGNTPLSKSKDLMEIHAWISQHGINRLPEISSWDDSRRWKSWDLSGIPNQMHLEKSLFLAILTDCTPVNLLSRDKWGWGNSCFYSVAQGYNTLHPPQDLNESATLWKKIWNPLNLPKVNFFCWVLMHKKNLIGKNMEKRGFIGPHRFPMCFHAPEMMEHLFVDCPFNEEVWKLSLQGLNATPLRHISVNNLFSSWKVSYSQEIQSSPTG
jgi:hypothetical protein